MAPFIVGDGDICDELVEMDLGELVYISVCFPPFANEFDETGTLGGLGKDIEVELDMANEDGVVGRETHIGEFILVLCDI